MGLPANFLIFDEYVAFMDMLGRENAEVLSKLKQIVMLGRQSGFFESLPANVPMLNILVKGFEIILTSVSLWVG